MDKSCFNFSELDEIEIAKDEEIQRKEIQVLLANEFYDLEVEEDYEDNENIDVSPESRDCEDGSLIENNSQYDKENVYNSPNIVLQDQTTPWLSYPMTAFYGIPQTHNTMNYKHLQTNNNYQREEVPINWEISLHGEMGPSAVISNNNFYPDEFSYMATSSMKVQESPYSSNINQDSSFKNIPSPIKIIKRDVAIECIPVNQRELDNLELLYAARGRRIEQLQKELDSEKDKRLKETRILNHKVTLLESEQKNVSIQLKTFKIEVNQQRQSILEKEQTIVMQSQKLLEFESQVEELRGIVDVRGSVIESLHKQIEELNTNTNVARNNQKQAELMDCINHQFDTDSQRLQKEILRLSERVDEKIKEVERLQVQIDEQTNVHQSQKRLWVEEKRQINDELDEERNIRKNLESSLNQEKINHLLSQISEVMMEKSMIEDMHYYLQEEVVDLTNQLLVYEQSLSILENQQNMQDAPKDLEIRVDIMGGRRGSLPFLSEMNDTKEDKCNNLDMLSRMRKETFLLTNRTHSLTNRLIEVRKDNLEAKSTIKKLQHTIAEQNDLLFALEEKFAKSETRLSQLQSGNETDVEKQLRNTVKSLEIVKESLELQCKCLQTQLKDTNETLDEMRRDHHQLENEFCEYKKMSEEDRIESIEEVKMACSSHYDNLRQQLEISWRTEEETFVLEEQKLREQLHNELSEAFKEVDRVKKLYIELSQQKTDHQSELIRWNEWLNKKLEDQKRSLNQQFQNDYQSKIIELTAEHDLKIEGLRSELEIKVIKEDKFESTEFIMIDAEVQCAQEMSTSDCQVDVIIKEKSVQTIETIRGILDLEEQQLCHERLRSTVNELTIDRDSVKCNGATTPVSYTSPQKTSAITMTLPHIIRSSTPQMTQITNHFMDKYTSENEDLPKRNFHTLFRSLKEDLVLQLTKLSGTMQGNDSYCRTSQTLDCPIKNLDSIDKIKDQLYNYILQIQARAASTLQEELRISSSRARHNVLRQLRQILPLTLSVDGEIVKISSDKMKVLIDKIVMILDRFHDDNVYGYAHSQPLIDTCGTNNNNNCYVNHSGTSTPKLSHVRHKNVEDVQSDVSSICSDLSFDFSPKKVIQNPQVVSPSSERSTLINDTIIRTRDKLQDEITKLSLDLQNMKTQHRSGSIEMSPLFAGVDHNWLCHSESGDLSNNLSYT